MSKKLPGVTRIDRRTASGKGSTRRRAPRRKRSTDAPDTAASEDAAAAQDAATSPGARESAASAGAQAKSPDGIPPGGEPPPESGRPAAPDQAPVPDQAAARRRAVASGIIARYAGWTAAGGMLPVPVVDIVAVSSVQVRMIGALARLYGVPFTRERGRAILSAIVGGVVPQVAASWLVGMFLKSVPGVALGAKLVGAGALSTAGTRVLGDLFVRHFESGGNLAAVDVDAMRRNFRDEVLSRVTPAG